MRDRRSLRILLLPSLAVVLGACALAGSAASAPQGAALPRSVLVGFRPNVSLAGQSDALADAGVVRVRRYPQIRSALVTVGAQSTAGAIRDLDSDPRVAFAEPNFTVRASDVTPNDPFLPRLWGLDNTGQTVNWTTGTADADIDAKEAWSVSTGSPDVVVAVIDTGVDVSHPDLAQNIWVNPGEDCAGCRTNGVDDDGNGYVDDWRGWDFVNGDNNPTDDNGHGTHVAGTIAAAGNNGLGVTGVTWSSKVMPLKFLAADGTGTAADAISAILYARAKGVPMLSNSWGGDEFSQAMLAAIHQTDESGELFVAAAGNDFTNTDTAPNYPSGYDVPNVLAVGATDQFDRKAWFSNYGARSVDLAAPGTNVYSTWRGGTYRFEDGTSMAAPHVAGAAALAKAVFPNATGVGLKALLLRTVDPLASLAGTSRTGGRLNADHAARCSSTPQAWIESPAAGSEVSAGQPLQISILAGACGSPTALSATLNGSPLPLDARGDGLYTTTINPDAGALNLVATATAGAATDTQTVAATANQSYEITPGGAPVTVTTHSANENAWLFFDGQAGHRVSLRLSNVTIGPSPCCSTQVTIAKPDGGSLGAVTLVGTNGGFVDTRALPDDRPLPDPGRPAGCRDRLDDAHAVRRPTGHEHDDRAGRPAGDRLHERPRAERERNLRRHRRRAGEPGPDQRHDRLLGVLLVAGLDHEAGWLDPRLRHAVRHERRLRRHEDAAGERDVHDPRRPAARGRRLRHADALRRPAGRDRPDHAWRPAGDGLDGPGPRPERCPLVLRHRRPHGSP